MPEAVYIAEVMKRMNKILAICLGFSLAGSAAFAQKQPPKTAPAPTNAPAAAAPQHPENPEAKREALNKKLEERKIELNKEKQERAKVQVPPQHERDSHRIVK